MTRKTKKKLLSLILSMMLIVAMAFFTTACSDNNTEQPNAGTEIGVPNVTGDANSSTKDSGQTITDVIADHVNDSEQADGDAQTEHNDVLDVIVLGEGESRFLFTVADADGNEKVYEIYTDKTMVGEALLELELIAGDAQEYGLYVKTVDGLTVDYNTDGKYWAFYVNGEYAVTGVDATPITEGEEYAFKVE